MLVLKISEDTVGLFEQGIFKGKIKKTKSLHLSAIPLLARQLARPGHHKNSNDYVGIAVIIFFRTVLSNVYSVFRGLVIGNSPEAISENRR